MTWWPFSGSGSSSGSDAKAQSQPHSESQIQTTPLPPNTHMASDPSQPNPPPAEAPLDPDFYAAHPHLAPPSFSTASSSSPKSTSSSSASASSSSEFSAHTSSGSSDEPFDPLLPRTMSCREAFDSAFYCSSFGGHFNDIYRYGQLRSCSEHWSDFWFCMRVKNSYNQPEMKQRMIQDRYKEKEEKIRSGPNSEDVWRVRKTGEEVKGAFGMGGKDAES